MTRGRRAQLGQEQDDELKGKEAPEDQTALMQENWGGAESEYRRAASNRAKSRASRQQAALH
ncbi:hypothetical protein E2C01_066088 [Portunus trituberculatus]|uniref:Uncharacterized protein n=1 Tax=Portunus trituberculatus TaxID=210409 RepID=A0A5B7HSX9_PORTR|nr:hypothetical protein [Portunus trituberculatus]